MISFYHTTFLQVAKEVKGSLHAGCMVYSVLAGVNARRISDLIEHACVMKPSYTLRAEKYMNETDWNYGSGVTGFLSMNEFKQLTCPIAISVEEMDTRVVGTSLSLLRNVFLQTLNISKRYSSSTHDSSEKSITEERFWLCNRLLFGDQVGFSAKSFEQSQQLGKEEAASMMTTEDGGGYYVMFKNHSDGVDDGDVSDTLPSLVDDSTEFCRNFEKHYKMVLDRFVDWTELYK